MCISTKMMQRKFLNICGIEIEICIDTKNKYFIRHNLYWFIVYGNKTPDPVYNCVIDNLKIMTNNRVETIKWAGYDFKFEKIIFEEDGMEVEAVTLPVHMFEDFICYQAQSQSLDHNCGKLGNWLETNSIKSLL